MSTIELTCTHCNKVFLRRKADYNKQSRIGTLNFFCSTNCHCTHRAENRLKDVTYNCKNCNKSFFRKPSSKVIVTNAFCSKKCSGAYNLPNINPDSRKRGSCKICLKTISSSHIYCVDCRSKAKEIGFYKVAETINGLTTIREKPLKTINQSVKDYHRKQKVKAVNYLGGGCKICGYNKSMRSLHFHHRHPSTKEFGISGRSISWEKLKPELDKCDLLCSNCHGEMEDLVGRPGVEPGPYALTN